MFTCHQDDRCRRRRLQHHDELAGDAERGQSFVCDADLGDRQRRDACADEALDAPRHTRGARAIEELAALKDVLRCTSTTA
jgi:hypothetical protein